MIGFVLQVDAEGAVDGDARAFVFDSIFDPSVVPMTYVYEVREVEVTHQFFAALTRGKLADEQERLGELFTAGREVYSSAR